MVGAARLVTFQVWETAKITLPQGLTLFFFGPRCIILLLISLNKRAVFSLAKPKLIGSVCSDSGSLSVVDPTHIGVSETGKIRFPAAVGLGTVFETEVGDGEFQVYELRDRTGRLRRIVIDLE